MVRTHRLVIHQQVPYLVIARPWKVGRATFWPGGMLAERIQRSGWDPTITDFMRESLVDNPSWATVSASGTTSIVRDKEDDGSAVEEATSKIRDAIAALRLYKLSIALFTKTELQDFGLSTDIASVRVDWWVFRTNRRLKGSSAGRRGSLGNWEFTREMAAGYRSDPRFAWLDAALVARARTDWQDRILAAMRTLMIATPVYRPETRIILAAIALEGLFGKPYAPRQRALGGHELARRASFVWCGDGTNPHGPSPGRPTCPVLTSRKYKDYERSGWRCSWYDDVAELYEARNRSVHSADEWSSVRLAERHEFTLERIVLLLLARLARTGETSIDEHLEAIDDLPAV